ncbi:MAG: putative P-loop ATPase/GTPase [uncultured archaeon A07HR60]|nr:MAG: putative P-loop ATPase/GTPase [uncultured archaeon A07HR60]
MTTPRFLVAGGARVDAGKTTFATGFCSYLLRQDVNPLGVKPRAGNDFWHDYDAVRSALSEGALYGRDVARLAGAGGTPLEASSTDDDESSHSRGQASSPMETTETARLSRHHLTDINPIHRLWRPTPGETGLLGEQDRTFLIDRVATQDGVEYVVNGSAEQRGVMPSEIFDALELEGATRVTSVEELNQITAEVYLDASRRLVSRLEAATRPLVIESYGDVAVPLELPVDAVAVVDPSRVRLYRGSSFLKSRDRVAGSPREGRFETHTAAITDSLDPVAVQSLSSLSRGARENPEQVASRYADIYARLVDLL